MNDIKLEILQISHELYSGDAILYVYSDNNLIDAVTITKEFKKSASSALPASNTQIVQIIAKDLEHGNALGSAMFPISLVLEKSEPVKLSLVIPTIQSQECENESGFIKIVAKTSDEIKTFSQKERENNRENDIYRAMKSELDIEKWKNIGLKQIREEMNSSELARVSVMQKMCKTVEAYEEELQSLKKTLADKNNTIQCETEKNYIQETLKANRAEWESKSKKYEDHLQKLKKAREGQELEKKRIKAETIQYQAELMAIKLQQSQPKFQENLENPEKIQNLKISLCDLKFELELNKSNLIEALERMEDFQAHNTKLRSYIQSLEEKSTKLVAEDFTDITQIIHNHLDLLSINATVVKITENLYKIDHETLYLYVKNGELMTQQDSKVLCFVEWLQKNKWKSYSRETEESCDKCKKLDTVPEEEDEDEIVFIMSPAKPVKQAAARKSPNARSRDYMPILRKKDQVVTRGRK